MERLQQSITALVTGKIDVGMNTKALQLRSESTDRPDSGDRFFHQISDGGKALVGLYMVKTALATGAAQTVLIDKPT